MSWMLCWRAGRRGERARGVAHGTRGSRSKSCAEVMPREMVCSKVPLRSKLHNMVSNMVIVEQSKRQSIAARSIGKRGVATCGRKRWCLLGERACAACWCDVWCNGKQCCSNGDLLLQQRFAPHQARNVAGGARAARRGVEQAALRMVCVREAAACGGCVAPGAVCVCASSVRRVERVLHRAKKVARHLQNTVTAQSE